MTEAKEYRPLYFYRGSISAALIQDYLVDQNDEYWTLNANTTVKLKLLRTNYPISSGLNNNNWDATITGSVLTNASGYVQASVSSAKMTTLCDIKNASSFNAFWIVDVDGDDTQILVIPRQGLLYFYG